MFFPRARGADRQGERVSSIGKVAYASIPLCKATTSKGCTTVWGKASDGRVDHDGQIVSEDFMVPALREFGERAGPIRLSHNPQRPVGKALEVDGLYLKAAIIDRECRRLTRHGVLKAFSVGIAAPIIKRDPSGRAPGGIVTGGTLLEVSVCDEPSNAGTAFTILKARADGTVVFGESYGDLTKKKKNKAPLVVCTSCGLAGDPGERFCSGCGHESAAWTPLADRRLPMNRKGSTLKTRSKKQQRKTRRSAEKMLTTSILTKAAGAGVVVHNRGEAIRAMLRADLAGPDPGKRAAAAQALRNLGAL